MPEAPAGMATRAVSRTSPRQPPPPRFRWCRRIRGGLLSRPALSLLADDASTAPSAVSGTSRRASLPGRQNPDPLAEWRPGARRRQKLPGDLRVTNSGGASEELDRLRRQVESLEIENAELRTRQSLETPVMPLNAASRIGWTCVLPIELVLKIGEWLPAGSKTLATFMLSCRAMYGLLLRHHRNVVCTESLATRARLDQRIHQLASAGTLEKVKELRMSRKGTEDSVPEEFDPEQWPDADVAFRLMAESCPNLERLQCSLQLGYMPALFATLQLGKLALLDLAFTDSRFSGGSKRRCFSSAHALRLSALSITC
ncbi:hypothetical protein DFJ74DRAFT_187415 [Hyaloraphidium curvatum]|nr:hypothetical protein DFJ74DRAFT_187415 [Hyaloraphidium curvatum]